MLTYIMFSVSAYEMFCVLESILSCGVLRCPVDMALVRSEHYCSSATDPWWTMSSLKPVNHFSFIYNTVNVCKKVKSIFCFSQIIIIKL